MFRSHRGLAGCALLSILSIAPVALPSPPALAAEGAPGVAPAHPERPLDLVPDPTTQALKTQRPDCCGGYDCTVPYQIVGTVTDAATNAPIIGAHVTFISSWWGSASASVLTGGTGQYATAPLEGSLTAVIEAGSYMTLVKSIYAGCYDYCCWGSCAPGGQTTENFAMTRDPCAAWNASASDPTPRAAATAVATSPYVYVLGGANASGYLATNSRFSATAESWSSRAAMPEPRAGFAAGLLGSFLYVAGGINSGGAVTSTRRFDTTNNAWAPGGSLPDMPNPSWGVAGVTLGGRLWVLGGYNDPSSDQGWLRAYNPSSNTWTSYAEMDVPRSWLAAAVLDGKIFAIGGATGWGAGATFSSVEIYDPATNTWTNGPDLPQPLKDLTAVTDDANHRILVIGGTTGDGASGNEVAYRAVMQLKPAATPFGYEWSYLNGYPTSGAAVASGFANGQLFGFGGRTAYPASYSALTWKLTPAGLASPPALLTVSNTGTGNSLALKWIESPSPGVTGYIVHRTGGGPAVEIGPIQGLSYVDAGLTRGTSYTYRVAAVTSCGTGVQGAGVTRAPDLYPVLFVHGLCSSHEAFTDCSGAFPCWVSGASKIGDALFQLGLQRLFWVDYSRDEHIDVAANTVAARIDAVLAATGDAKLNIVAHSQGGLVARYLAKHGYAERIHNLVMIGTPNHGSDLSRVAALPGQNMPKLVRRYIQLVTPCQLSSDARYDLRPGSTFLNQLNYGARTHAYDSQDFRLCAQRGAEDLEPSVQYWLFHGTGSCRLPRGAVNILGLCEPHDGVVETGALSDGDLVSLAASHKATDVGLSSGRASHNSFSAGSCVVEETQHPGIISGVYNVLTSGSISGAVPTEVDAVPLGIRDQAEALAFGDSLGQQVYHADRPIAGGDVVWDTVAVSSASRVSFLQTSDEGLLTITVRSPSGTVLTLADSAAADVDAESEALLGYQGISIAFPEDGAWIIESTATPEVQAQSVSVDVYVVSEAALSVGLPDELLGGGAPVPINAVLRYEGASVVAVQLSVRVTAPDSTTTFVELLDDGQHDDGMAADGLFGGAYMGASQMGGYGVTVEAEATIPGGVVVRRMAVSGFVVQFLPDLDIRPEDVRVTRLNSGNSDTLAVTATIRNLGAAPATNVVVAFRGATSALVSEDSLSVPAGGSATASGRWVPARQDLDTLLVYVDRASRVMQSRYDNDSARVATAPGLVSVAPNVATLSLRLAQSFPNPARGEVAIPFALPRAGRASLGIYDIAGRLVRKVVDAELPAGTHFARWDTRGVDGAPVAAGVYFYELRLYGDRTGRRLIVVR